MPIDGEQAIAWFSEAGYRFLPVEPEHAAAVARLAWPIIRIRSAF